MRPNPSILPELKDFAGWTSTVPDAAPITLLDYVGFVSTPDLLFAFAALFSPDLVAHNGARFLASGFSVRKYDAWARQGKSTEEIQRVLNHVHIATLLQQQEVSDRVATEAARVVAEIWSKTLGPEGLQVETTGTTLHDAAVTFYERPAQ